MVLAVVLVLTIGNTLEKNKRGHHDTRACNLVLRPLCGCGGCGGMVVVVVVVDVVMRTLCLSDVSVQATQHLHLIQGARRLGTSPGRLRDLTPVLMTGAPEPQKQAASLSTELAPCEKQMKVQRMKMV